LDLHDAADLALGFPPAAAVLAASPLHSPKWETAVHWPSFRTSSIGSSSSHRNRDSDETIEGGSRDVATKRQPLSLKWGEMMGVWTQSLADPRQS